MKRNFSNCHKKTNSKDSKHLCKSVSSFGMRTVMKNRSNHDKSQIFEANKSTIGNPNIKTDENDAKSAIESMKEFVKSFRNND